MNAMTSIFASAPRSASIGRVAIQATLPASRAFPGSTADRVLLALAAATLVCLGLVVALSFPQRTRAALDHAHRSMERLQQYESLSTGAGLASVTAPGAIRFQVVAGTQPGPPSPVLARDPTHTG